MIEFKFVFCKDHNLFMYLKFAMTSSEKNFIIKKDFDFNSNDFSEDDLFDIDDLFDEDF